MSQTETMACEMAGLLNKGDGKNKWGEKQKGKFSGVMFKLCLFLNMFKGLLLWTARRQSTKTCSSSRMTEGREVLCSETPTNTEQNSVPTQHIQIYK